MNEWENEIKDKIRRQLNKYIQGFNENDIADAVNGRLALIKAASKIVNKDLDYVCGTDGLSDVLFYEKEVYQEFLDGLNVKPKTLYPSNDIIETYADSILNLAEMYGWEKRHIVERLTKYMGMESPTM